MAKIVLFILLASTIQASIYTSNCIPCHQKHSIGLDKLFYLYLLKYSSEIETKYAIKEYLKNPIKKDSILDEQLLKDIKIKQKSRLSENELKRAIDEYWNIYKVFGKLK
jgi:hypothetical protein